MDRPLGRRVSVDYATADGTATAPADYSAVSGTLTFAAGETVKTIGVALTGNSRQRFNEDFTVALSNPVNAHLSRATGLGIIINAEAQTLPLSVSSRSVRATSVLLPGQEGLPPGACQANRRPYLIPAAPPLRATRARRVVVTLTFTDRFGARRLSRVERRLRT